MESIANIWRLTNEEIRSNLAGLVFRDQTRNIWDNSSSKNQSKLEKPEKPKKHKRPGKEGSVKPRKSKTRTLKIMCLYGRDCPYVIVSVHLGIYLAEMKLS